MPALRTAAKTCLKTSAAGIDALRPRPHGVAILLYHRVGGRALIENDLPEELFRAQLAELAAAERVVDLDSALALLSVDQLLASSDPVVLTFDDGTADFADIIMPRLAAHVLPATLYLATDFIERTRAFPHHGAPLSWAALRDVVSTGLLTIGSHTHTHALLDRVGSEVAATELDRSIALIEDRLGVTPRHFAYPKSLGAKGEVEREVRRRFRSAALAGTRLNRYGATDPHRLARSPVQRSDGMRWFRHKLEGGMAFEDMVRRASWRVRYARKVS